MKPSKVKNSVDPLAKRATCGCVLRQDAAATKARRSSGRPATVIPAVQLAVVAGSINVRHSLRHIQTIVFRWSEKNLALFLRGDS